MTWLIQKILCDAFIVGMVLLVGFLKENINRPRDIDYSQSEMEYISNLCVGKSEEDARYIIKTYADIKEKMSRK